ncbi:unnamed protein product, partial [Porites lobata]
FLEKLSFHNGRNTRRLILTASFVQFGKSPQCKLSIEYKRVEVGGTVAKADLPDPTTDPCAQALLAYIIVTSFYKPSTRQKKFLSTHDVGTHVVDDDQEHHVGEGLGAAVADRSNTSAFP